MKTNIDKYLIIRNYLTYLNDSEQEPTNESILNYINSWIFECTDDVNTISEFNTMKLEHLNVLISLSLDKNLNDVISILKDFFIYLEDVEEFPWSINHEKIDDYISSCYYDLYDTCETCEEIEETEKMIEKLLKNIFDEN